jgi:hypothetical protein
MGACGRVLRLEYRTKPKSRCSNRSVFRVSGSFSGPRSRKSARGKPAGSDPPSGQTWAQSHVRSALFWLVVIRYFSLASIANGIWTGYRVSLSAGPARKLIIMLNTLTRRTSWPGQHNAELTKFVQLPQAGRETEIDLG